jgi:hypothetical protein
VKFPPHNLQERSMATIVTRAGKGSALTHVEADANFENLNNTKLESLSQDAAPLLGGNLDLNGNSLLDNLGPLKIDASNSVVLSGTTGADIPAAIISGATGIGLILATNDGAGEAAIAIGADGFIDIAAGAAVGSTGDLTINNMTFPNADGTLNQVLTTDGTGTLSWVTITQANGNELENVVEDLTPQLGGDLDIRDFRIVNNTVDAPIIIEPNGTGALQVSGTGGINLLSGNIFSNENDNNITITAAGTQGIIVLNSDTQLGYITQHAEVIGMIAETSGILTIDPANGPIQIVGLTGNCTINGFTNGVPGQTVTVIVDNSSGAFTLTLDSSILVPGGVAAITDSGLDILTITLIDDDPVEPLYFATIVNNFQPTV